MAKIKTLDEKAEAKKVAEANAAKENETKVIAGIVHQHRTVMAVATIAYNELKNLKTANANEYYIKRRKYELADELLQIITHELSEHGVGVDKQANYYTTHTEAIKLDEDVK